MNSNNNNDDMSMDFIFEIETFPIAENNQIDESDSESDNSGNDSDDIPPLIDNNSSDDDNNQPNNLSDSLPDSSNNSLYNIIQYYQEQQLSNQPLRFTMNPVNVLSDSFYSNIMVEMLQDAMDEQILNQALQASLEEEQPEEKRLLSQTGQTKIKHFQYDADVHTDFNECPISMDEFKQGDQISQLPCEHVFLKDNIMKWLMNECARCPVCRYELDYDTIFIRPSNNNTDNSNNVHS